jgi:hypothetical protein
MRRRFWKVIDFQSIFWKPKMVSKWVMEQPKRIRKSQLLSCRDDVVANKGWVLTRVAECEFHRRKHTLNRFYSLRPDVRPKPENVEPANTTRGCLVACELGFSV